MAQNTKIEYNNRLVFVIRPYFESSIIVGNVIHVFHKYDTNVLTLRDIDSIKAFSHNHGTMEGARYLLDFLHKYDNWFVCLMKVLRDPEVRQHHIADDMEALKANLDREFTVAFAEIPIPESAPMQASGFNTVNPSSQSFPLVTDSPFTASGAGAMGKDEYITPTTPPIQNDGLPLNRSLGYLGEDTGHSSSSRVKVISDIPARDFKPEEVTGALSSIQGWHHNIEDKQVLSLLKKYIDKTGSFILWYWKNKRRPAICVTHDGEIKTLIVHKRPMAEDQSKVDFYFINKEEKTSKSLKDLVDHHLKYGVNDLTKKPSIVPIYFKYPVLP